MTSWRHPGLLAGVGLLAVASIAMAATVVTDESQLIGAERCGACHSDQYRLWKAGPHARAFQVLNEHERKDPRCYACHSTGLSEEQTSVQCESCHGAGRHYAKVLVMRDLELARVVGLQQLTLESCMGCHTEDAPNVQPFDPADKLRLIRHWRPERDPKPPAPDTDASE